MSFIPQNLRDLGAITAPTIAVSFAYRMGLGGMIVQRGLATEETVRLGTAILSSLAVGTTLYKLGSCVLRETRDQSKTTARKVLKITSMISGVAAICTGCACIAISRPSEDENPTPPGAWMLHIKGCQHGRVGQMDGPCDGKAVVEKLLGHPNLPSGVIFEEHRLVQDMRFGNCSAMSLDFANEVLSKCYGKTDADTLECLKEIGEKFKTSGRKYRDIQAGLNTISTLVHRGSDIMLKKVRAIACYWDLQVVEAIPEFLPPDFAKPRLEDTEIVADIVNASEGVHFVRSLRQQLANRKGEICGHSTLLIKLGNVFAYFDPNRGLLIHDSEKAPLIDFARNVRDMLARDHEWWKLVNQRLFLLAPGNRY